MNKHLLEQLFEFLREDPNDAFTLYAIATEYSKSDEKKSLEYYQKLLQEHPGYIATYYHAGKLYEKLGNKKEAEAVYKKGMELSKKAGKFHAFSELQAAYNQLMGLDFEDE